MICVSLLAATPAECRARLREAGFAEVRLDAMAAGSVKAFEIRRLFSSHPKLIATCRPGSAPDSRRLKLLLAAIEGGAAFVDVELESSKAFRKTLVAAARETACRVLVSHHDFVRTPPRPEMEKIFDDCFRCGGDIAKIACRVRSRRDAARLLGLLDDPRPLVVVGLGRKGAITRIAAPLCGALFTYACPGRGEETAPGQIPRLRLERLLREIVHV